MKCFSKTMLNKPAFSLVEVLTALSILAIISSSVLVVINRSAASGADSALRMRAFEVARENMEKLLSLQSVNEMTEYGESDKYPEITWQTVVETFYEPVSSRMWLRGVCSTQYVDSEGSEQTVELTAWLTDLTKNQLLDIMSRDDQEGQLAAQLIATIEEAAEYAGVDVEVIESWLENGLLKIDNGSFVKANLDIFIINNGQPGEEDKKMQVQSEAELLRQMQEQGVIGGEDDIDPKTGLTYKELRKLDTSEVTDLMKDRR
ncbi:MAG: prepilin-type N-terminal cleavage/methylation domain-containing protein [Sedimentisphaerales bacterium]|nr:prepilin-type N-terminal cleavage/methylation domain-containing protein [Sedimentisphaerales bacterium]